MNGGVVDYTASGNLRMLGTRRYAYDAFERLTQVEEASQVRARFTYTSSGERIKSVDLTGPRTVTQYLLADDFDFDATRKLARTHIALGSATVATLTAPYAPTPLVGALPPAAPAPFPAAPVVAGTVLLLALLGLALLLAQRHRRGLPLARPALASGLVLALWIASVPSSAWALPLDGDLNQDGRLDGADALIALEIAQGRRTPSSTEPQSGDVAPLGAAPSTPSAINPADALLILRGAQNEDVDQDGLASQAELTFGSSPFKADTDGDGMADLTEFLNGTNPRDPGGDSDGDGRTDAQEIANGTDPFDRDTDGDGLPDNTDVEPLRGASFLHADQLGSTILTTGANAAVLQRVAYRPYGATVAPSSGPTPTPRFGFTGQRLEGGIGIYDYRARFYDPALGRFLQPDPIVPDPGNPQTLNRYSYVENNPANKVDPSGNQAIPRPAPRRPDPILRPPRRTPRPSLPGTVPRRPGPRPPQNICGPAGCPVPPPPSVPGLEPLDRPRALPQPAVEENEDGEVSSTGGPVIFDTQILFNERLFDQAEAALKSNESAVITRQGELERDRNVGKQGLRLTERGARIAVIPDSIDLVVAGEITRLQRQLSGKSDSALGGLSGDGIIGSTAITLQIPLVTQEANFARAVEAINTIQGGRPDLVRFIGDPENLRRPKPAQR